MGYRTARIDELQQLKEELEAKLLSASGAYGDGLQEAIECVGKRIAALKAMKAGPMFKEEVS